MAKVTSITGMRMLDPPEANAKCVEILEEWLGHAKAGDFVSVALVAVDSGNRTLSGLTEHQFNISAMIGALFRLQISLTDPDEGI